MKDEMKGEEKRVRYFPVEVQMILEDVKRSDLVEHGVVEQIGNNMREKDIHILLPETADENHVFSAPIKPNRLNLPGTKRFQLCATERANDKHVRSVKVFCYTNNGTKPVAFYFDEKNGVAKMVGYDFIEVYANDKGSLNMSRVWVEKNFIKMQPLRFAYDVVLKKYRGTMRDELLDAIRWALNTNKAYAEAVIHTLDKVWNTNGYANKVYAVRYERKKTVAAPAPKTNPGLKDAQDKVNQINGSRNVVADRVENGGAAEDRLPPQPSADAQIALEAKSIQPEDDTANRIGRKGSKRTTRAKADKTAVMTPA